MNSITQRLKNGLNTFDLKIIGIVLMVVDHFHQMFLPFGAPSWLDWFGRPVATIFFFTSVVGFSHTHSKKNYMLRLYISMILMSFLGFGLENIVKYDKVTIPNNIFRDLFIGTLFMLAVDKFQAAKNSDHKAKNIIFGTILVLIPLITTVIVAVAASQPNPSRLLLMILTSISPALLLAENNIMTLLIPLLYIFKDNRKWQCLLIAGTALIYGGVQFFMHIDLDNQWIMIFAAALVWLYNGEKGRGMKYFFYIFYPAHLAIFYLISAFLSMH